MDYDGLRGCSTNKGGGGRDVQGCRLADCRGYGEWRGRVAAQGQAAQHQTLSRGEAETVAILETVITTNNK